MIVDRIDKVVFHTHCTILADGYSSRGVLNLKRKDHRRHVNVRHLH